MAVVRVAEDKTGVIYMQSHEEEEGRMLAGGPAGEDEDDGGKHAELSPSTPSPSRRPSLPVKIGSLPVTSIPQPCRHGSR